MQTAPQELDRLGKKPDVHESLLPNSEQQSIGVSNVRPTSNTTSGKRAPSTQAWSLWKVQILSWCGSLCCFIATIVVLEYFEGQPVPELRFGITPSAIIGILATLTELLLILPVNAGFGQIKWLQALRKRPMDDFRRIDEASRGPWGSVLLLAKRRGGLTGSFGALVTILALGIATFTQQALSYHTIFFESDNAEMPTAQIMNGTGWAQDAGGQDKYGVDPQMLSAPYVGMFSQPHTTFTAKARCGTSNCTWEPYQTLAVCNTCVDLSSRLRKIKATAEIILETREGRERKRIKDYYTTNHYALPNGFTLFGKQSRTIYGANVAEANGLLNLTTTLGVQKLEYGSDFYAETPGMTWESIAFANNGSKLFSVLGIGPSNGSFIEQPDSNFTAVNTGSVYAPPVAFECMLQYCVRTMRADTVNGSIHETELSTWTDQTQLFYNATGYLTDIVLNPPDSATTFHVNGYAGAVLSKWLSTYLQGYVDGWRNVSNLDRNLVGYDSHMQEIITHSSLLVQPLYQAMNESNTGFPNLMQNLAGALSLGLRNLPYQPAPVKGKAYTSITRAVVTWPWLALPALELLGSLVFLITVMLETRRRNLVPWTNNVLAYFFHGLDERPVAGEGFLSQDEMEGRAKAMVMEFRQYEDGGRLVVDKL